MPAAADPVAGPGLIRCADPVRAFLYWKTRGADPVADPVAGPDLIGRGSGARSFYLNVAGRGSGARSFSFFSFRILSPVSFVYIKFLFRSDPAVYFG